MESTNNSEITNPGFLSEGIASTNFSDVFTFRRGTYLNEFYLYLTKLQKIPNCIEEENIRVKKAHEWFKETYKDQIQDFNFNKRRDNHKKNSVFEDVFYFLWDDLIVNFDFESGSVRLLFKDTTDAKVNELVNELSQFRKKTKSASYIYLLLQTVDGIDTRSMKLIKPKLNIEDNYNDDFLEIHEIILKRLLKKNDKGIVLLHGKPGTGKTSYIRYLIGKVKKRVIFLPPNMAPMITNPELLSLLVSYQNSIFVIEDAENIVVNRDQDGSSPVSSILNISDGLLSDCLNIQVICSFNTDLSKIDPALTRKGRLIATYEFKELATEKARHLSEKLGFQTPIDSPMILGAIYNQDEKDFEPQDNKKSIGFSGIFDSKKNN
ncbi:AAA family ATPase [Lunatibacter salilacus]|uniref:AAA family ATPase n=1 Tax=Lunatibacter salilacus TaxID=2483804 RepID=UPI00131AC13D|nr:AAA family ATPase [Lunatibacter salilacus]